MSTADRLGVLAARRAALGRLRQSPVPLPSPQALKPSVDVFEFETQCTRVGPLPAPRKAPSARRSRKKAKVGKDGKSTKVAGRENKAAKGGKIKVVKAGDGKGVKSGRVLKSKAAPHRKAVVKSVRG